MGGNSVKMVLSALSIETTLKGKNFSPNGDILLFSGIPNIQRSLCTEKQTGSRESHLPRVPFPFHCFQTFSNSVLIILLLTIY